MSEPAASPLAGLQADGGPGVARLGLVYGIVGRTASRSMSPLLHNAGYRALGLPAVYLPFETSRFAPFWRHLAHPAPDSAEALVRGLTITAPYKEEALRAAACATPSAERAGAANILLRRDGAWMADTTDTSGVLGALRRAGVEAAGRKTAVVGCGGAGRAAALALSSEGATVTLVNRGPARARLAARLLGLTVTPLATFDPAPFDLVVHATPVHDHSPFAVERLRPGAVVLDMVYGREPTALAIAAAASGLPTVDGWAVLASEVGEQFRLMTGRSLPDAVTSSCTVSAALHHLRR